MELEFFTCITILNITNIMIILCCVVWLLKQLVIAFCKYMEKLFDTED